MRSRFNYTWLLALVPLAFVAWFVLSSRNREPVRRLPYFGPKVYEGKKDTMYHQVPAFSFTNQFSEMVTESSVAGKIYVADFFFTTCKTICPVMNDHLARIYTATRDEKDFLILSHTVDPETDTPDRLRAYAESRGASDRRWQFLTGDKKSLYVLARKGYLLSADEGDGGAEDFVHTQNFALVDKERRIRGFYDGTDSLEMVRLMQEIRILLDEYAYKKKNS
jgi:protein SCO1